MGRSPRRAQEGETLTTKRAKWYMQYIGECPVCGKDKSYKEARYTEPPPKDERYENQPPQETYDHCAD